MSRRLILSAALSALATPVLAEEVVVFAASALKTALDEIAADFQAEGELYKTALYDLHQELGGKVWAEP